MDQYEVTVEEVEAASRAAYYWMRRWWWGKTWEKAAMRHQAQARFLVYAALAASRKVRFPGHSGPL